MSDSPSAAGGRLLWFDFDGVIVAAVRFAS
jgi:hypothetical protein